MRVRLADVNDNKALLELTRKTPMVGNLRLRIDRDPDFFEILRKSGEYKTFVVEDGVKIIACWTLVSHPVYINGSVVGLHYCRDLKLDPDYQSSLAFFRLARYVREYQKEMSADLHFTVTMRGNKKAISTLGGRAGLNKFEFAGSFLLNFCILFPFRTRLEKYELETNPDMGRLSAFYNHFYKKYQLGPVITPEQLKEHRNLVLNFNGKTVAALTLENPIDYRKTVVMHFPLLYKIVLAILRVIGWTGLIAYPPVEGETMKILYIKYAAYNDEKGAVKKLIKHCISMAYREKYHYLCMGLHERDPLLSFLRKLPGLKVTVLGYLASLKGSNDFVKNIIAGVLFEDHAVS